MHDEDEDPDRPHRIAQKAREISDFLGKRQRYYADRAQDFGYSKEVFQTIGSGYETVPDDPALSATEKSLSKFYDFMRAREKQTDALGFDVSSASYAIGTAVSSTASVVVLGLGNDEIRKSSPLSLSRPPQWSRDRVYQYADKLQKLHPELGKLARSVWQSFYSGMDGAERSSLFLMRQLYDQFFSILSPNEKVRESLFFKIKDGDKAQQVYRRERLLYAAATRVADKALRDLLSSEVDQVLETYDRLNRLHERGAIDPDTTRDALIAMQAVIEQWVDAVEL